MVRAPEPHHLEGECLLAEVVWRAEPDWQIDLPDGLDALGVVLGRNWSNPIPSRRRVCT
jgi:hypothetical protein